MSEHILNIYWKRTTEDFELSKYNREHVWHLESGETIHVSSAPDYFGNASLLDPEQALVGALSSCHMLTFFSLASKKGYVVNTYNDDAKGILEKGPEGKLMITKVELTPVITFDGNTPDNPTLEKLHQKAHQHCFIANSVKTTVVIHA
jgi:organic hydroperoxide reductase OsmC/OhrA